LDARPSTGAAALIRAERNRAANHPKHMNETETEVAIAEIPLPESHRELELLLEALHALNDALDQYETEAPAKADVSTGGLLL
jgi:hypothetical protein